MKKLLFFPALLMLISCTQKPRSIEEVKSDFGNFDGKTIKMIPIDYTKTPANKAVEHNPEEYAYLKDVNIFSIGHLSDGLFLTGLLVAPKKEGKYPVIVFNRGGNQDLGLLLVSTAVNEMASFAAKGYILVGTNYRGNSRGEGKEQFGGDDVNDVFNLIESLAELEMADVSRVGLLGMSRGGMMNYLMLKKNANENIRAVVNIGGITDLNTTVQYHPQIEEVLVELIPDFQLNRNEEIKKRSAVYWVNQFPTTTPLLLLHGINDQHVDYSQIPPFTDSLQKYAIPFNVVSFQEDNHGIINHKELVSKRIYEWFDTYVKKDSVLAERAKREIIE